jgi:hypothetical protein
VGGEHLLFWVPQKELISVDLYSCKGNVVWGGGVQIEHSWFRIRPSDFSAHGIECPAYIGSKELDE